MTKPSPFRYFRTSPEITRLAVMLRARFPPPLRNAEDLLHERGIAVHPSVRKPSNSERAPSPRANFRQFRTAALAVWRGLRRTRAQISCPCGDCLAIA